MAKRPASRDSASGGREPTRAAWIAACAAVIVAVITGIFGLIKLSDDGPNPHLQPTPMLPSKPGETTPSPVPLSISTRADRVPACTSFEGTGDVPAGQILWIAVQGSDDDYWFKPTEIDAMNHKWVATNVSVGDSHSDGNDFVIWLVLVDSSTSGKIDPNQPIKPLSSDMRRAAQIKVTRNADNRDCP